MSEQLDSVITAYLNPDKEVSLKSALDQVEDINTLGKAAKERSETLSAIPGTDITDQQLSELETCTQILTTIRLRKNDAAKAEAEAEEATKAAEAKQEKLAELKTQLTSLQDPPQEDSAEVAPDTAKAEEESDAVTDTQPPVVEAAEPAKELATASFSVANLPNTAPSASQQLINAPLTSTFAVDSSGAITDRKYESVADIGDQILSQLGSYSGNLPGIGTTKNVVAAFRRTEIDEFIVNRPEEAPDVIERVVKKQPVWDRSKGQFAAGWCAPSESLYELCPYVTSLDGIVDLPEVVASRGGVRTTSGPNFATLYANAAIGQVLTEAQVIAGTVKTCIEIDCPPFVETRLDVNPLCITGNLLTLAGYPEYVERFMREAVAANAHKINLNILLRMVAASTAVNTTTATTGPIDTASSSEFLDYVSLYAVWLRDRYRLRQDSLIEVVAPYWLYHEMQSDLVRRTGVDLLAADARLREAFASRNIRIQWVYDWQPMAATAPGQIAPRPLTAQVLVYIPGTFVKLTSPVINLGTIHSAAQLATNQYTAAFVEEGFNVLERCFESLVLTLDTCPSGNTGAANVTCDVTP